MENGTFVISLFKYCHPGNLFLNKMSLPGQNMSHLEQRFLENVTPFRLCYGKPGSSKNWAKY
jgi:hypothetical protein